jgi:cytidyltransferase-like protein
LRRSGKKEKVTVFAAGCFNRLHPAHLQMLRTARSMGDELVVVLSNDAHNKKPNAVPAQERQRRLEASGVADRVVIGRADSFAASLREVNPKVLVLGYDQRLPDAETEQAVRELGIRLVRMPWYPGKERSCGDAA